MKCWAFALAAVILSACAAGPGGLSPSDFDFISKGGGPDPNQSFEGLYDPDATGRDIRVLYAHGISCHDPNYSAAFQRRIAEKLGFEAHELPTAHGIADARAEINAGYDYEADDTVTTEPASPLNTLTQAPYFDFYAFDPFTTSETPFGNEFVRQIDYDALLEKSELPKGLRKQLTGRIASADYGPYGFDRCNAHKKNGAGTPPQWYDKNTIIVRRFYNETTDSWLSFYEVRWSGMIEHVKAEYLGFDTLRKRHSFSATDIDADYVNKPAPLPGDINDRFFPAADSLAPFGDQGASPSPLDGAEQKLAKSRKRINRLIKDELINARLVDGLIYLGDGQDEIQYIVETALEWMTADALASPEATPRLADDLAPDPWFIDPGFCGGDNNAHPYCQNLRNLPESRAEMFAISESMGSKIILDSILAYLENASSENSASIEVVSSFLGRLKTHFMFANQIPLVDVASFSQNAAFNLLQTRSETLANAPETSASAQAYQDFIANALDGLIYYGIEEFDYLSCIRSNAFGRSFEARALKAGWKTSDDVDIYSDALITELDAYLHNAQFSIDTKILDPLIACGAIRNYLANSSALKAVAPETGNVEEEFLEYANYIDYLATSCFRKAYARSAFAHAPLTSRGFDEALFTQQNGRSPVGFDAAETANLLSGYPLGADETQPKETIWRLFYALFETERSLTSSSEAMTDESRTQKLNQYLSYLQRLEELIDESFAYDSTCSRAASQIEALEGALDASFDDDSISDDLYNALDAAFYYIEELKNVLEFFRDADRSFGQYSARLTKNYWAIRTRAAAANAFLVNSFPDFEIEPNRDASRSRNRLLPTVNRLSRPPSVGLKGDNKLYQNMQLLRMDRNIFSTSDAWYSENGLMAFKRRLSDIRSKDNQYTVVSITDNNDLLGYQLEETFQSRYPELKVINVNRAFARGWPLFANPGYAHRAHKTDAVTQQILICGYPEILEGCAAID
ncbi:MAG: hypothetical protein AAGC95_06810 [Pseudomonadota bacterium]